MKGLCTLQLYLLLLHPFRLHLPLLLLPLSSSIFLPRIFLILTSQIPIEELVSPKPAQLRLLYRFYKRKEPVESGKKMTTTLGTMKAMATTMRTVEKMTMTRKWR